MRSKKDTWRSADAAAPGEVAPGAPRVPLPRRRSRVAAGLVAAGLVVVTFGCLFGAVVRESGCSSEAWTCLDARPLGDFIIASSLGLGAMLFGAAVASHFAATRRQVAWEPHGDTIPGDEVGDAVDEDGNIVEVQG